MMGYWIHRTRIKLIFGYSPLSPSLLVPAVLVVLIISITSFLVTIISVEVTKTNTSFSTLFWVLRIFARVIIFSFAVKTLDIRDVFLFSLDTIEIYCRGVIDVTLLLPTTTPKISLVVIVFFTRLALMSERLLEIFLFGHISIRKVSRLILLRVLDLFFG